MCELNPKHVKIYRLEFFTSQAISKEEWERLVVEKAIEIEQQLNASGKIRVHIHEVDIICDEINK